MRLNRLIFIFISMACMALSACSDDEPAGDLFEIWVSEAPTGTEITINDTECDISTTGEGQTVAIALVGDYDDSRIKSGVTDWMYCTTSKSAMKFRLNEFCGDENDIRSADIKFTVTKGKASVNGRIIIHQHALKTTLQD